jgi:hypothetical protein
VGVEGEDAGDESHRERRSEERHRAKCVHRSGLKRTAASS